MTLRGRCLKYGGPRFGGVAEWLKAAVLKTADREVRGFESHRLRLKTGVVTEWPKVLDC